MSQSKEQALPEHLAIDLDNNLPAPLDCTNKLRSATTETELTTGLFSSANQILLVEHDDSPSMINSAHTSLSPSPWRKYLGKAKLSFLD